MKTAVIAFLVMLLQSSQAAVPSAIFVMGQVKAPGMYPVEKEMRITSAISAAGGFGSEAGEVHVFFRRSTDPANSPIHSREPDLKIPREDVESGKAFSVTLKAGDTVFVSQAPLYFVTGHVRRPGAYALTMRLSVWQAVAAVAGGLTERAAMGRIYVVRVYGDKTRKIEVGEDDLHSFVVRPHDTIVVPPRRF